MPSFLDTIFPHRRSRSADTRLTREPPPAYYTSDSLAVPVDTVKRSSSSSSSYSRRPTSSGKYNDPQWFKTPMRRETAENALELLVKYDTVILMDDSASMMQKTGKGGTRWQEAGDALAHLATTAAQYDSDGIDIHFLNRLYTKKSSLNLRTAAAVREVFEEVTPAGFTPTGERLDQLLKPYISRLEEARIDPDGTPRDPHTHEEIKRVNFIVITDGRPTDEPLDVIIQLGIQFVQIGNDPKATAALNRLDDDLAQENDIPDIVDTTPYSKLHPITADGIIKCLIGGINRRVDKQRA
ncbi:hypothetical protein C8F01DRAFT_1256103 [Mycena amicta]|nr:hypothetical protein C8F01DRAFT_1256103 [Mycena amicta]